MEKITQMLEYWNREGNGDIVFSGTEQAIFYATLIFNLPDKINEIKQLRKEYLIRIKSYMELPVTDLDWLMDLSCRAQFYRECLEEVERLKNSTIMLQKRF